MKKLFTILALLCAASLTFAQKAGDKVTFSSKDMNGNPVTSELFSKNKLTMVNVWGTFCPPCIREMPDLAKLNQANKAKGVEVIGIPIDILDRSGNVDSSLKADGDAIIKQTGANYTHVIPTKDLVMKTLNNIQAVPATFFVDKEGKIVSQLYFGAKSQKDWQKLIDDQLKNLK